MFDSSIHLAPNAPWLILAVLTVVALLLGLWAYRFSIPPLPRLARRLLPALRIVALSALLWLLAQPVLERASVGGSHLVVLLDRSRSMELPVAVGGTTRAAQADRAVEGLRRAWRGRANVEVLAFASRLSPDSGRVQGTSATALGDALGELALSPVGQRANGVVVVSDGLVNAGDDPVAAATALGLPVHAVIVGERRVQDRAITGVESSSDARVGRITPVRVHLTTSEERGRPIGIKLVDGARELARTTVFSPGAGAEVTAEFRVTPVRPGLAVWTVEVDSLAGEITAVNNTRQVAVQVAPGRLGVLMLSAGLNWDLSFIHRALTGDSSLSVNTLARERGGWTKLGKGRSAPPVVSDLHGQSVVVLDALSPGELSPAFDQGLADFARGGGAVMALGGLAPGLGRYRTGKFGRELALSVSPQAVPTSATPEPAPDARELLSWDDDPARGERAWRGAAPLSGLAPIAVGAGDRVLIRPMGGGPPLMTVRRVGRGQVLLVNGSGLWRWSLSGHDDLTLERGRRLWRGLVHWLAEPAQGEPLRVRPERWLASGGEPVRLFATLQDAAFRPLSGATVEGTVESGAGSRRVIFEPRSSGSYVATLHDLAAGRYRVSARASRGGSELGRASTEFAVDRWSLEEARTQPDSAMMAAMAQASGGRVIAAEGASRWAHALETRTLARGRSESVRLWESPWVFAIVVGALSLEWGWRRRRGLP